MRFFPRVVAYCTLTLSLSACGEESAPRQEDAGSEPQAASSDSLRSRGASGQLSALLDSIRTTGGEFTRGVGGEWTFHGDNALLARPYNFGHEAVDSLVACLDDQREGNMMIAGRRLPTAIACYQALSRTAYPTEFEDGSGDWPGTLGPDASADEIRAAAAAWRDVVRRAAYRLA
jgi:hypothetical protein